LRKKRVYKIYRLRSRREKRNKTSRKVLIENKERALIEKKKQTKTINT